MSIKYNNRIITQAEMNTLLQMQESWLIEKKGKDIKPAKLTKTISAFANTNGGDIYLGISNEENKNSYNWDGFDCEEKMNQHIDVITAMFDSYDDFSLETYQCENVGSFVLHVVVHKTQKIVYASDSKAYVRHGVQNLPCDNDEKLMRLRLDKGLPQN